MTSHQKRNTSLPPSPKRSRTKSRRSKAHPYPRWDVHDTREGFGLTWPANTRLSTPPTQRKHSCQKLSINWDAQIKFIKVTTLDMPINIQKDYYGQIRIIDAATIISHLAKLISSTLLPFTITFTVSLTSCISLLAAFEYRHEALPFGKPRRQTRRGAECTTY